MERKLNKSKMKGLVFLVSILLILVNACNESDKEDAAFEDGETSAYESEQEAQKYFNVIESISYAVIQEFESSSDGRIAKTVHPEIACAEVDWDEQASKVVVDFGEGCEGPDGRIRKGKVIIEYTIDEIVVDSEFITSLENFYVDGVKVEGTRTIVIESISSLAITYTEEIEGGKIIWPNETFITRESEGLHTLTFSSLQLEIEGEASGTTVKGVEYNSETIAPLVFKSDCLEYRLPVSGLKTITVKELPVITVDYGNGDCDNAFTVSIGTRSKEISLK